MIKGVIYKYTCPNGTTYIGQTINECYRRGLFFNAKHYGGGKIDQARREFGPENFIYTRLCIEEYQNKKEAKLDLDRLEAFYIKEYNSVESGYNSYHGINLEITTTPRPSRVYKSKGVPPIKYAKLELGMSSRFKKVKQFDLQENFIASYKSMSEASRVTDINLGHISKCCQGKAKRVQNYIFKFDI